MIRVTVWNEFQHERTQEKVKEIYPDGIHTCIAKFLRQEEELSVRTAVFDEKEHGLTEEVLANTDVLVFWNHMLQEEFSDDVAERVRRHVLAGMGLVVLHSGHYSKIMRKLLGTSMTLRWRHGDRERLFCTCPTHPIAQGIPAWVDIPEEEMYGEFFDIPKPDDVVFTGWFAGGEVFRSGCTPVPVPEVRYRILWFPLLLTLLIQLCHLKVLTSFMFPPSRFHSVLFISTQFIRVLLDGSYYSVFHLISQMHEFCNSLFFSRNNS